MTTPVEKAMGSKLPTIGVGQKVERAVKMLETSPALLVLSGGRPLAVVTRTDILSYFEAVAIEGGEAAPTERAPARRGAMGCGGAAPTTSKGSAVGR